MTTDMVESILRLVAREVWIVTAAGTGQHGGLLATWVSQASIDPERPVMLIGIAPNHHTAELIESSGAFALHLLARDAAELAWNFARDSGRDRDKLTGLDWSPGLTGSPVLKEALACLECRTFARLATGDRNYYWGEVVASSWTGGGAPLTDQQFLAASSDERKRVLLAGRQQDIQVQRPWHAEWRGRLPALLRPAPVPSPHSGSRESSS